MPDPRPLSDAGEILGVIQQEQHISADDHFGEPPDLWEKNLPAKFRDHAAKVREAHYYETSFHLREGAWDAHARLKDMALSRTSAAVLYPTLGADLWKTEDPDPDTQWAHIEVYNNFVIDYCRVNPDRLWGLTMCSPHLDVDKAVAEAQRGIQAGLRGVDIPVGPPLDLPYSDEHYEKFWAACEEMRVPIVMHINTGPGLLPAARSGKLPYGAHKFEYMKVTGDLVGSQVCERHPNLNFVFAECGAGWLPFFAQEYSYYAPATGRSKLPMPPSEYIKRQIYVTFIGDEIAGELAEKHGQNFMWSSDYPHPTSTWPHTEVSIAQDLGHVSPEMRALIIRDNACKLFNGGKLPPQPDPVSEEIQSLETWNVLRATGQLPALPSRLPS